MVDFPIMANNAPLKNCWTSFFYASVYASVLLVIMNFVITLSKLLWIHEAMIRRRIKTDVNLFFHIVELRALAR